VTVVEMQEQFGMDMGDTIRWSLIRILRNLGVKLISSLEVKHGDQDFLYIMEKAQRKNGRNLTCMFWQQVYSQKIAFKQPE